VIGVDLRNAEVTADLSTAQGRAHAVAEITRLSEGVLDGFLPFAGVAPTQGRPGELVVSVNYFGAIAVLEGVRPLLRASESAAVILVASNSTTVQPNWPVELAQACLAGQEDAARELAHSLGELASVHAYPATKAALAWYARTKSAEYIREGIRLNAIAPGVIDTPMTREGQDDPRVGEAMKQFVAATPVGRAGRPEEVADLVTFLLSERASFIVGSVIFCDGGMDAALRGTDWPAVWSIPQS
jgi:NAD(P)-dependent dehydrogenase (short-subunit alcohol dehydrogenase family)